MGIRGRFLWFVALAIGINLGVMYFETTVQPDVSTKNAVEQVNGPAHSSGQSNAAASNVRTFELAKNYVHPVRIVLVGLAGLLCFGKYLRKKSSE